VPIPCQKGGMGVEMRVLVRISPNLLLPPDRFRVKPYPSKQKKGGGNLPLKDLVRWPVCWAKMVHFWKPWKHASWPPPECRKPFSMLPRHALSSFIVWNAGVGPWWAATAEIQKNIRFWQGWVIRRRRIIRRIVFITYISVFFELLRIIRFWALDEFCSHKPPRAPQKHSQALKSPTEALPSPLEPPRGTPSPSERSMITWWCL